MSDYEMVDIFLQYSNNLQTHFMNYVAVLFAFLIAAYLIAHKLESSMAFIIIGLFTLVAMIQGVNISGAGHDFASLGMEVAARASQDSTNLDRHGTQTWLGHIGLPFVRFSTAMVVIVSYLGGLIFFFHQRHVGRAQ